MNSHPLRMALVQNPKWRFTNGVCMYKMSVIIILIFFFIFFGIVSGDGSD